MKKGVALFSILTLLAMGFISAQNTLSDLLGELDQSIVILFAVFMIAFALSFLALNRVFKEETMISGIIAAVLAFLVTYGVNSSGLDIGNLLSGVGLSETTLFAVIPLLIIAGAIFVIIQMKKDSLFVFGGLLIAGSFFVYTKTLFIVVGIILILVRFFIRGKEETRRHYHNHYRRRR